MVHVQREVAINSCDLSGLFATSIATQPRVPLNSLISLLCFCCFSVLRVAPGRRRDAVQVDGVTVLLDRVRSCSPMWPQTPPQPDLARRHSAPPEFPSSPSSKQELSALPDQPLRHFLYGLLGDTGRCSSEKHDDRESELRREGVHNFLAVCRFVPASRTSPTFIRWLNRRCRGTSSRCSCSATPHV